MVIEGSHENFYEKEDFKREGLEIPSDEELEKINHPPEKIEVIVPKNSQVEIGEKIIGKTPTGEPLYEADDPGEMYKQHPEDNKKSALERTPIDQRIALKDKSYIDTRDNNGNLMRGIIKKENGQKYIVVKRVLDEDGQVVMDKRKGTKYETLTPFDVWYSKANAGQRKKTVKIGMTFYSGRGIEDKSETVKMREEAE